MGRQWYKDGKVLTTKNTFLDFVTCAQYLVDQQYTPANGLLANGGSAGGMLMGAGHSGESERFERRKLPALKYVFMLDLLGVKE